MQNPYEIDNRDVTELSKEDLPVVLNRLLWLEGRRLGIPPSNIETSLRLNDPDGGVDARVRDDAVDSCWIPDGLSIWQFKAGRNITLASILGEVSKPGVRQGLAAGGTYCLAISADFIPAKIDEMKGWLQHAVDQVQPGAPQRLVHASHIAQWATEHPSMLFSFDRPVYGICSVENWLKRHPLYQIPFQEDKRRPAIAQDVRRRLAPADGPVHVRLQGFSGGWENAPGP